MLLNAARTSVSDWDGVQVALCPDCGSELIARRGDIVIWHWAHKSSLERLPCEHEESLWHLACKEAWLKAPDWEVEVPIEASGNHYRLDAFCRTRNHAREFVHSLSESYIDKHHALERNNITTLWIWDGHAFHSSKLRTTRKQNGLVHLLRTRALLLHDAIGGYVHFGDYLFHRWKSNDIWYPLSSSQAPILPILLSFFSRHQPGFDAIIKANKILTSAGFRSNR